MNMTPAPTEIQTQTPAPTQEPRGGLQPIRLGEFFYEKKLITAEQLLDALADHWLNGGRIGDAIERLKLLSRTEIEHYAALYHGLDVVEVMA